WIWKPCRAWATFSRPCIWPPTPTARTATRYRPTLFTRTGGRHGIDNQLDADRTPHAQPYDGRRPTSAGARPAVDAGPPVAVWRVPGGEHRLTGGRAGDGAVRAGGPLPTWDRRRSGPTIRPWRGAAGSAGGKRTARAGCGSALCRAGRA